MYGNGVSTRIEPTILFPLVLLLCVYVDVVVVYIITKRVDLSVKHIRLTREKVVEIRMREDSSAAGYVTNDSPKKSVAKQR